MKKTPTREHRTDGYASPVYHASPWRIGYPRNGAVPIRKIRLPAGHPSGVEEEQQLCKNHVQAREWWAWVAKELEQPLIVLQLTNGGKP